MPRTPTSVRAALLGLILAPLCAGGTGGSTGSPAEPHDVVVTFERTVANVEYASVEMSADPPATLVKPPAAAAPLWWGEIMRRLPGDGPEEDARYVLFAAEYRDGAAQRAWCDADFDGDLADDPPVKLSAYPPLPRARSFLADLRWTARAGSRDVTVDWTVRVVLEAHASSERPPVYRTQMVFAMSGTADIGSRPHRAILFDGNGDGLYTKGHADGVFVDLDDDRRFLIDTMSHEFGPFGTAFPMGGRRYEAVSVDLEGKELRLRDLGPAAGAAERAPRPGEPAPEFEYVDAGGKAVRLADRRGNLALVYFWSSGCAACERQAPALAALYARHRSAGFEILGVSYDTDRGAMEAFRARHGQSWPTSFTGLTPWEDPVGRLYRERAPGVMYLVDRRGRLEGIYRDAERLASRVEELLRSPASPMSR